MIVDYSLLGAIAPKRKPVTQTVKYDPETGEEEVTIRGSAQDLSAANPNTPTLVSPQSSTYTYTDNTGIPVELQRPAVPQSAVPQSMTSEQQALAQMQQQAAVPQPILPEQQDLSQAAALPQAVMPQQLGQGITTQPTQQGLVPGQQEQPQLDFNTALGALQAGDYNTAGQYALTNPQFAGAMQYDLVQRQANDQTINQRYQELESQSSTPQGRIELEKLIKAAQERGEGGVLDWIKAYALSRLGFKEQANKIANSLLGYGTTYENVLDPNTGESVLIGRNSQGLPTVGFNSAGEQISVPDLIRVGGFVSKDSKTSADQILYDPTTGKTGYTRQILSNGRVIYRDSASKIVKDPEVTGRLEIQSAAGTQALKLDTKTKEANIKLAAETLGIGVDAARKYAESWASEVGQARAQGFAAPSLTDFIRGQLPTSAPQLPAGAPAQLPAGVPATVAPAGVSAQLPAGVPAQLPAGAPAQLPAGVPAQLPAGVPAQLPAAVAPAAPAAVAPAGAGQPLYQQRAQAEAQAAAAKLQATLPAEARKETYNVNLKAHQEFETTTRKNPQYLNTLNQIENLAKSDPDLFGFTNSPSFRTYLAAQTDQAKQESLINIAREMNLDPKKRSKLESLINLTNSAGVLALTSSGLAASQLNSDKESARFLTALAPTVTNTADAAKVQIAMARANLLWQDGFKKFWAKQNLTTKSDNDYATLRNTYDELEGKKYYDDAYKEVSRLLGNKPAQPAGGGGSWRIVR